MQFKFKLVLILMNAFLPETIMTLNCRKEPIDRNGKNSRIPMAVDLWWIRKTNSPFFSPWMANSWVSSEWGNWFWLHIKCIIFKSILGKQIPISPSVPVLFPTIRLWEFYVEANFGDDPAKPFEFDTKNFPGLGLASIWEERKTDLGTLNTYLFDILLLLSSYLFVYHKNLPNSTE
jgi:hypothetical protein